MHLAEEGRAIRCQSLIFTVLLRLRWCDNANLFSDEGCLCVCVYTCIHKNMILKAYLSLQPTFHDEPVTSFLFGQTISSSD